MKLILAMVSTLVLTAPACAEEWSLPDDGGLLTKETVQTILEENPYPELTDYTKSIEYIDFTSYGQPFTQVVVTLTPEEPRMHDGKKIVVVGGEPGSEYAMDFIETVEEKEGPGVWLAKRGVTFIALTRVGRWNFFDESGNGDWSGIPLDQRMPIFSQDQDAPWTEADFKTETKEGKSATGGDSKTYRFPKADSPLYNQMLAATPRTFVMGYQKALEHVLPPSDRDASYVLFWGMSTGGAFLYPLADQFMPDGYLGWGTSSTGIAYAYRKATKGDFSRPYSKTALRLRERGLDDFVRYTKNLNEETRLQWWENALKGPRFKSAEDTGMQFNVAALTDVAMQLWLSDFLPEEDREVGFADFLRAEYAPSFPAQRMKEVNVLEMTGTLDEAVPPSTVSIHREVMEPYARNFRTLKVENFQHYLFTQDSIDVVGSLWLRFIESGYFDQN